MRVLVIFHVYYESLAGYYLAKMRNIHSCEWNLIVTGNGLSDALKDEVRQLKPDAEFMECPNIGYDVWPFIKAVKSVDLGRYDLILKFHTKNEDEIMFRFHGKKVNAKGWRDLLVNPIIGDAGTFGKILRAFSSDSGIGIAYGQRVNCRTKGGCPEDGPMLSDELRRLGIERKSSTFCSGTMFAVRASALEFLKRDDIDASIFEPSGPSHGKATMAHVYERLIPIVIVSSGAKTKLIPKNFVSGLALRVNMTLGLALQWIFSLDYYGNDRTKHLKVFGHIFVLSGGKSQPA